MRRHSCNNEWGHLTWLQKPNTIVLEANSQSVEAEKYKSIVYEADETKISMNLGVIMTIRWNV